MRERRNALVFLSFFLILGAFINKCFADCGCDVQNDGLDDNFYREKIRNCEIKKVELENENLNLNTSLTQCEDNYKNCDDKFFTCQTQQKVCNKDLFDCKIKSKQFEADNKKCYTNLESCNKENGKCDLNYKLCLNNLEPCNTERVSCLKNLTTCESSLSSCQIECNEKLGICNKELDDCNLLMEKCEKLKECCKKRENKYDNCEMELDVCTAKLSKCGSGTGGVDPGPLLAQIAALTAQINAATALCDVPIITNLDMAGTFTIVNGEYFYISPPTPLLSWHDARIKCCAAGMAMAALPDAATHNAFHAKLTALSVPANSQFWLCYTQTVGYERRCSGGCNEIMTYISEIDGENFLDLEAFGLLYDPVAGTSKYYSAPFITPKRFVCQLKDPCKTLTAIAFTP